MKKNLNKNLIILVVLILLSVFAIEVKAGFNEQINFQGKLTDSSNVAVPDGDYNMEFKLWTTSTATSTDYLKWTETCTSTNKITVTNGLFSHLLGSVNSLPDDIFNQTLWLGVNIGGTSTDPVWDGEMTPRKKLGAVPAAFEAKRLSGKLESAFATLAENETIAGQWAFNNIFSISASTSTTALTLTQSGTGYAATFTGGNVGIGTTTPAVKLHVYESALDKSGVLINIATTSASYYSLDVQSAGTSRFYVRADGNVGIATSTPAYLLDVYGGNITIRLGATASSTVLVGGGSGKLTAGTLDPIYNIDGVKYATYIAGMTGIKEETTGVIRVDQKPEGKDYYRAEIDFNNLEEGSDLWLFSKVTNLKKNIDRLSVLLTPAGRGHVWYQVDPENFKLYFYSEKLTTISYRLTAPRFDWEKWKNLPEDSDNIQGLIVNEDDSAVAPSEFYKFNEENNLLSVKEDESGKIVQIDPLSLKTGLASFGIMINEYGYLEVETLKAKKIITEEFVTKRFEMIDEETGEVYCVWIKSGDWVKVKGGCGDLPIATSTEISPPESTSTESTSTESTSTESTSTSPASPTSTEATSTEATSTEATSTESTQACIPNWQCSDWQPSSEAVDCGQTFIQKRVCTDLNNCGTDEGKPAEEQEILKNCE
jgi:hypothetical protein